MSPNERQPLDRRSPGLGWIIFGLLLIPGIVSAIGLQATRDEYGTGGLVGLFLVAPITCTIATVLLAKDQRRRRTPMTAPGSIVMFLAFLAAAVALSFGCCVAIGNLV